MLRMTLQMPSSKNHQDLELESLLCKPSALIQEDELNVEKPLPISDKGEVKRSSDNGAYEDEKLDGTNIKNTVTVIESENKHRTHHDHKHKHKSRKKRHRSSERGEYSDRSRKRIKITHEYSKSTNDQSHRLCESLAVLVLEEHTSSCRSGDIGKISERDDCLKKSHSHSQHTSDHDAERSRRRKKSKKSRSRSTSRKRKENSKEQTNGDASNTMW